MTAARAQREPAQAWPYNDGVLRIAASPRAVARRAALALALIILSSASALPTTLSATAAWAAPAARPFGLPFDTAPGPSTWLFIQGYGNTTSAYRWRVAQYGLGQGLHFGLDFAARCGTPVVAIGDGVITDVDNLSHGAGPHNLIIKHANGYASLYGHLLKRPLLAPGNVVRRGQVIALTGDPDLTCSSRPHLHLEIRTSPGLAQAVNPILLIDANWDALAVMGGAGHFERDLNDPRQWQYLDDQPQVTFGGPLLNQYSQPWPADWNAQ